MQRGLKRAENQDLNIKILIDLPVDQTGNASLILSDRIDDANNSGAQGGGNVPIALAAYSEKASLTHMHAHCGYGQRTVSKTKKDHTHTTTTVINVVTATVSRCVPLTSLDCK